MTSQAFRDVLTFLDPNVRPPDRKTVVSDSRNLKVASVDRIKRMINDVQRITICSDIWTKKGMRSSFMGVTATMFHPKLKRNINVVLGIQKFSSTTHKADDSEKQKFCLGDEEDTNESDVDDGDSNTLNNYRGVEDGASIMLNDKTEMNPAFRRLTCFIHTTLVCLREFEFDDSLEIVIQRIKSVVNKFSSSHVLTSELVQATCVGLVSFCDTRWNYVYLVLVRILRVRDKLTKILKNFSKTKYLLSNEDWLTVVEMKNFLEPFHRYTNMAAKEQQAVSSEVVPTILSLYVHLDEYEANDKFKVVASKIKEKMKAKFSNWFYEQNSDLESSYLVATFLDPRYRMVLPLECKDLAKKYLLREYRLLSSCDSEQENSLSSQESQASTVLSRFPLVQKMKNTLLMLNNSSGEGNDGIEAEVHKYAGNQSYDKLCDADDVFNFWLGKIEEYPCLAPLALDYLSIPDSSGHVERVFGTSSAFTKGLCNKLDGVNLGDKVFLKTVAIVRPRRCLGTISYKIFPSCVFRNSS